MKAFHQRYFDEHAQTYAPVTWPRKPGQTWGLWPSEPNGSQTSLAMALSLGAPPDEATRASTFKALVQNVVRNDGHLTVGMFGMQVSLGNPSRSN